MQLVMTMPVDAKTGKKIDFGKIFYSTESDYAMVFPRPQLEDIVHFYNIDDYYTSTKSHFESEGKSTFFDRLRLHLAWRFDHECSTIFDTVRDLPQEKITSILEVGCGGGDLLQKLTMANYTCFGVEADPMAKSFSFGLNIFQGTAEKIPNEVKNQKFDLVIMSHVLEHCLDPSLALDNVFNLLRPGGYFICEVPNNSALGFKYSGVAWEMLDIPRHLNFFTPISLVSMIKKYGFQVQRLAFWGYCRQFSNSWVNTEAKVYERVIESNSFVSPNLIKNSKLRAWQLLFHSLLAKPSKKYDSVRIIAVRPNT